MNCQGISKRVASSEKGWSSVLSRFCISPAQCVHPLNTNQIITFFHGFDIISPTLPWLLLAILLQPLFQLTSVCVLLPLSQRLECLFDRFPQLNLSICLFSSTAIHGLNFERKWQAVQASNPWSKSMSRVVEWKVFIFLMAQIFHLVFAFQHPSPGSDETNFLTSTPVLCRLLCPGSRPKKEKLQGDAYTSSLMPLFSLTYIVLLPKKWTKTKSSFTIKIELKDSPGIRFGVVINCDNGVM